VPTQTCSPENLYAILLQRECRRICRLPIKVRWYESNPLDLGEETAKKIPSINFSSYLGLALSG